MKDFQGGWPGLKAHAIAQGVATVDDTDDGVCEKIKAVIGGAEVEEAAPAADDGPDDG